MKLDNKIEISIFDFFKYGKFDYITLEQTKEWILNNFPDPDSQSKYKWGDIWQYGNIEFTFSENKLVSIFSDKFDNFNGGDNLLIDNWILDEKDSNLIHILKILNENNIDYKKKTFNSDNIKITLESGVTLCFYNLDEMENTNINAYKMIAFEFML